MERRDESAPRTSHDGPKHAPETLKHLEKQNELLMDSYKLISDELHKLQVEEEMMMRKFYELMCSQRERKNNENGGNVSDDGENRKADALVITSSNGQ